MAIIKAFKGYRPKKGLENKIGSYPYDVISSDEARALVADNEYSFLHIVKPEVDLPPSVDIHDSQIYEMAKTNLDKFIDKGWLVQDESDSLYIYKQQMGDHEQVGLVVVTACDDYDNDVIKKHEHTRPVKEDDRFNHVYITEANCGPVFLTYKHAEGIDEVVTAIISGDGPEYNFVAEDGIGHAFWKVSNVETVDQLIRLFGDVDNLYVADGHHRAASGSRTRKKMMEKNPEHTGSEDYNYFLTVLFPDNQIKILPYNRVVSDLIGMSPAQFLEKLSNDFEVKLSNDKAPVSSGTVSMYLDGQWYECKYLGDRAKTVAIEDRLDVSILQNKVLGPLLGIDDPRTSERVKFVGGIRGSGELEKLVNSGEFKVAFSMFPTQASDIMDISDANKVMPPKSTWFEPKLRSGLVVHRFKNK